MSRINGVTIDKIAVSLVTIGHYHGGCVNDYTTIIADTQGPQRTWYESSGESGALL